MQQTLVQKQTNLRNYGIDALRLLAMFFVTILHTLGHGGVLRNTVGLKNDVAYLIEIIAYCAVNCYATVSGFVMYSEEEKPYRYSKYITMWLQVFFYSFGIGLLVFIIKGNDAVSLKELIKFALPVTSKRYWYFSAYTGLFFLVPFINKIIRKLSSKQFTSLIIALFVVFSCFGRLNDPFYLNGGYSTAWLVIMYLFGAWIKKCDILQKFNRKYAVIVLIVCTILTWGFKVISPVFDNLFISYLSPTVILSALCWVVIFSELKISKNFAKVIKFLSPAAFGVYIIHEHSYIKSAFIVDKFVWIAELNFFLVPIVALGCALSIFIICLFIEKIRLIFFKALKINNVVEGISSKFEAKIKKLANKVVDYII